jgi:ornithine cyclodeaminase
MKMVVPTVEEALRLHYSKDDVLPFKTVLRWGELESEYESGRINAMPAYVGGTFDVAGLKWIASVPSNPDRHGVPRATALIILNDPHDGWPCAVMDGTVISAMRTGAATGVAAKYLARKDSEVVGIIGAGVQGRTQLMSLNEILRIDRVKVYDIRKEKSRQYAKEMEKLLKLRIEIADSVHSAAKEADVLVTATMAHEPIVKKDHIEEGMFYSHVGGYEDEYDVASYCQKIVVDDWEQVKHRGAQTLALMHKDGVLQDSQIYAELGEIIAGKKKGREDPAERIYFNAVGLGTVDLAVAHRIYKRAEKMGLGRKLILWKKPRWV